jgi:sec-independent protein translocase protein TatA
MFEAPWHWVVLALVALILFFGWKQLPDMARSVGRSLRIFKTEMKGMSQDDKDRAKAADEPEEKPRALPPAQVVRNDAARPRPRPNPNGAAQTDSHRAEAQ